MSTGRTGPQTLATVACSPNRRLPGTVPVCAETGILGALTGVVGSLMALEVIREIVGFGDGLVGRLVMLDARCMRFETLTYGWDPSNPLTGEHPTIKHLGTPDR